MKTFFDDVQRFHDRFGIPSFDLRKPCQFPEKEILEYRLKFLVEEIKEFQIAIDENNLADALDALGDLVYVALGTAHYFNAPMSEIWQEIQRSNMSRVKISREDCPPDKQYRADEGLVMKPPGWIPPRIPAIIENHNSFVKKLHSENI